MKKTNAVRILDQYKILYELVPYIYDVNNLEVSAIAKSLNLSAAHIFKTLVAKGDKIGVVIALVPGDQQLHYKSLSTFSGNKKVSLIPVNEIQNLTGYIRGGCSPLGMKKQYPVFIDRSALDLQQFFINSGQRGLLIGVSPDDIIRLIAAIPGEIAV